MTLAHHFASNPAGERLVVLVELSHPTWADALRYAEDVQDWTVTLEDSSEVTFPSTGFDAQAAPLNDSGDDGRSFTLPDEYLILWRRIESNKGYVDAGTQKPVPISVIVRAYLSSDVSAPAAVLHYSLSKPSRAQNRAVTFTASNTDYVNRNAPIERYTWASNPGLRR